MDWTMPTFDQRILKGVAAILVWHPVDADGESTTAGTTVTVTVTSGDGTAIVTDAATTGTTEITYTLAATDNDALDWLTATWKVGGVARAATKIDVAGGYWLPTADIRSREPAVASTSTYPTATLIRARREAEDEAERIARVAFVPRYARVRLPGTGMPSLRLPFGRLRSVRSARIYDADDGVTYDELDAAELAAIPADSAGIAIRTDRKVWDAGSVVVLEVEHGYDRPPADLLALFPQRVRWYANRGRAAIDDDVITWTTPDGTTVNRDDTQRSWFAKLAEYGVREISVA